MRLFKYILIAALALMYACEDLEPEYLFDQSPEDRIEGITGEYADILMKPENGWIGYYTSVEDVGGFVVLLKFDANGNVN